MKWISTARLVLAVGLACMAGSAMAQPGATGQSYDALNARLEQQDQQIHQLQAQMAGMQQQPVNATPVSMDMAGAAPAADPAPKCAEVGSDMSAKIRFWNGAGIMIETPDKDFTMHIGGWTQWDNVWWRQNELNVPVTNTPAGIGSLQDGEFFRRIRLVLEGNFWETFEYRWNYAFENDQYSTIGLDEFWIADNKLPVIGTLRAGHVKDQIGLEGDMSSSSRCMTFMERSCYSESIELNQNFVTGVLLMNNAFDDRMFWGAQAFRVDNGQSSGAFFGTGQWGWQTRVTGLPIYEDDGRQLLHLGLSGGWRDGSNSTAGGAEGVRLRARPELRDDDPAASPGNSSNQTSGSVNTQGQPIPDANSNRLIDTGTIICNQEWLLGTELLYIRGPFSFQGEYGWNFCNNAQIAAGKPIENFVFNGGYAQVAYTLTGENRAYDKKAGGLARYYFGGQGPYENAFLVRDEEGNLCSGRGAWEIAARFSYADLNSGFGPIGTTRIQGGIMNGFTVGLNWYLNSNVTIMNDWVLDSRYDVNTATTLPGSTNGYGSEVQLSF